MRRSPRRLLAAMLVLFLVLPGSALAIDEGGLTQSPNNPTSGELVEQPKKWDGKTVEFTGETIAGAQKRGDHAWIHINDDAYYLRNVEEGAVLGGYNSGHAVWLPVDLTEKITHFGDYTHEGDVVRVAGTFNAACAEHGGDMDIHATSLEVVTVGHEVRESVSVTKLLVAIAMLVLAALLWFVGRRARYQDTFGAPRVLRRKVRSR